MIANRRLIWTTALSFVLLSTAHPVFAQDFTIAIGAFSPSSVTAGSTTQSSVTITSTSGFSSPVTLQPVCPAKVSCTLSPNPVTPPANGTIAGMLTVATDSSTTSGALTIVGTAGSIARSSSVTLTVQPPATPVAPSVTPTGVTLNKDLKVYTVNVFLPGMSNGAEVTCKLFLASPGQLPQIGIGHAWIPNNPGRVPITLDPHGPQPGDTPSFSVSCIAQVATPAPSYPTAVAVQFDQISSFNLTPTGNPNAFIPIGKVAWTPKFITSEKNGSLSITFIDPLKGSIKNPLPLENSSDNTFTGSPILPDAFDEGTYYRFRVSGTSANTGAPLTASNNDQLVYVIQKTTHPQLASPISFLTQTDGLHVSVKVTIKPAGQLELQASSLPGALRIVGTPSNNDPQTFEFVVPASIQSNPAGTSTPPQTNENQKALQTATNAAINNGPTAAAGTGTVTLQIADVGQETVVVATVQISAIKISQAVSNALKASPPNMKPDDVKKLANSLLGTTSGSEFDQLVNTLTAPSHNAHNSNGATVTKVASIIAAVVKGFGIAIP